MVFNIKRNFEKYVRLYVIATFLMVISIATGWMFIYERQLEEHNNDLLINLSGKQRYLFYKIISNVREIYIFKEDNASGKISLEHLKRKNKELVQSLKHDTSEFLEIHITLETQLLSYYGYGLDRIEFNPLNHLNSSSMALIVTKLKEINPIVEFYKNNLMFDENVHRFLGTVMSYTDKLDQDLIDMDDISYLYQYITIVNSSNIISDLNNYVIAFQKTNEERNTIAMRKYLIFIGIIGVMIVIKFLLIYMPFYRVVESTFNKMKMYQTELLKDKQWLDDKYKAKTIFLASIGHELRTPLNAIIGFSDLIKDESFGRTLPKYKEYAELINSSGVHLLSVINNILTVSKIESEKQELVEESFNMTNLLNDCIVILEIMAKDKGNNIVYNNPLNLTVKADKTKIKQVIFNIVSNAIKYSYPNTPIIIEERIKETTYEIVISDKGPGMTKEEIIQIFEPFSTIKNHLHRGTESLGLGIFLTHKMLQMHGGKLSVTSEKNAGTAVSTIIPIQRIVRPTQENESQNQQL